jgi:hypothetical protein
MIVTLVVYYIIQHSSSSGSGSGSSNLPYVPGELHMESETEGCLYPCGGAI